MTNIERLLQKAAEQGASDLHITAKNPPWIRRNGRLICLEEEVFSAEGEEELLYAFLDERQRAKLVEAGKVEFGFSFSETRCRVQVFQQIQGYTAVFRLFGDGIPEAEDLSIPQSVLEVCKKKQGLVILSGASGSGRTTTLSVLIEQINREIGGHILTLESPVEYQYINKKGIIHQREVGVDTESYSKGLTDALREDADVIAVGAISDAETICAMMKASEMGHLVFGVMDAVGAVETVEQIIELVLPEQRQVMRCRFADMLCMVVSQQLIPTLGGERRQSVFDVMYANETVKNLICEGKTAFIGSVMQTESGMQKMDRGIFELYVQGKIDRQQALQYVRDSSLLEKKLI